jgi:excisionase family DNA binding protein
MGSDFVSTTEAAKLLGRSRRTVIAYQQKGALRRVRNGRRVLIPKEDVESLAVDIGANLPAANRKTIYQLVARVQRLEAAIAVLKKAAGLQDAAIRPAKEEAAGLYTAATRALASSTWSLAEIGMWVDLYEKLDEISFDEISAYSGHQEAWWPFYQLCVAQTKQVAHTKSFETSLSLQQLHSRLCLAMKNMRGIILVWVEVGGGTALTQAFPIEGLLKSLKAKHS